MGNEKQRKAWYDEDKVDEMALALLWLTASRQHEDELYRAWKGMAWEVIDRLEARGLLYNSRTAKSVVLTKDGETRARELFKEHFGTPKAANLPPAPEDEDSDDE